MTPFWTGFVVGFCYFGVIVGAGRLCGLNALGADGETAADREVERA